MIVLRCLLCRGMILGFVDVCCQFGGQWVIYFFKLKVGCIIKFDVLNSVGKFFRFLIFFSFYQQYFFCWEQQRFVDFVFEEFLMEVDCIWWFVGQFFVFVDIVDFVEFEFVFCFDVWFFLVFLGEVVCVVVKLYVWLCDFFWW